MADPLVQLDLNGRRKQTTLDKLRVLAQERLLPDAALVQIADKTYLFGEIAPRLAGSAPSGLARPTAVPSANPLDPFASALAAGPASTRDEYDPFAAPIVASDAQSARVERAPVDFVPRARYGFVSVQKFRLVLIGAALALVFVGRLCAYLGSSARDAALRRAANEYPDGAIDPTGELTAPFNDDATKLPEYFRGADPKKIYDALAVALPSIKIESRASERPEEYYVRRRAAEDRFQETPLVGSVLVDSRLAFLVEPFPTEKRPSRDDLEDPERPDDVLASLDVQYDPQTRALTLVAQTPPAPDPEDSDREERLFLPLLRRVETTAQTDPIGYRVDEYYYGIAIDRAKVDVPSEFLSSRDREAPSWTLTHVSSGVAARAKKRWAALCVCSLDLVDAENALVETELLATPEEPLVREDLDDVVRKLEKLCEQADKKKRKKKDAPSPVQIASATSRFVAVDDVEFWIYDLLTGAIVAKFSLGETLGGAAKPLNKATTILRDGSSELATAFEQGVEARRNAEENSEPEPPVDRKETPND